MNSEVEKLREDIARRATGMAEFEEEAFAEELARRLEDAEQLFDVNVILLQARGSRNRTLKILGYAESSADSVLTVLVGQYFRDDVTLTKTAADQIFRQAEGFIEHSVDGWFAEHLEESSREAEYAHYFARQFDREEVSRIRLVLITDGVMSERIRSLPSSELYGVKVTYEIWDQKRILDAARPELNSESIVVDFTRWLPDGLPCLHAETSDPDTETFLAVIPARVLAAVYEEYGGLLLESNVRTFLSARGSVNKGMQGTLTHEPSRFLAYNNGLTTTAQKVEVGQSSKGPIITRISGWQIVNGGQTTASITHFLRKHKHTEVDDVYIQMKLVQVLSNDAADMVQSIARFANSQNRITGADLFASHPFHVRLEKISRRLRAPAREGEMHTSGWYYERARGQWENERAARLSTKAIKVFDLEYPRSQRLTKTDWAKYSYSWGRKPHLVSKGAQSVFAEYAKDVDAHWEKDDALFGDSYFRNNVGKAIMYESLRSRVLGAAWYKESPGYLANIVTYAVARFAEAVAGYRGGSAYDFERIWERQALSASTLEILEDIAKLAQRHLTRDDRPQANVTQWAKQQACWEGFRRTPVTLGSGVEHDLISADSVRDQRRSQRQERKTDSGFEEVQRVLRTQDEIWRRAASLAQQGRISPSELSLIKKRAQSGNWVPQPFQAEKMMAALERLIEEGLLPRDAL